MSDESQTADAIEEDDLLTPEERAAFEAEEGTEIDGSASLEPDPEEWADRGWGPRPVEGGADDGGDDGAASEEAETTAEAEQAASDAEPAAGEEEGRGRTEVPDVEPLNQKMRELGDRRKEATDLFEDGDISREEYDSRLEGLSDEAADIRAQIKEANEAAAADASAWKGAVTGYFKAHPGLQEDQSVLRAYDAEVRAVTGSNAYAHLSFQKQLELAHRRLIAAADTLGLPNIPKLDTAQPQRGRKPSAAEEKAEDLGGPPTTLRGLPQTDNDPGDGGRMAQLERAVQRGDDPEAIEALLSKLSPEERETFASMDL